MSGVLWESAGVALVSWQTKKCHYLDESEDAGENGGDDGEDKGGDHHAPKNQSIHLYI